MWDQRIHQPSCIRPYRIIPTYVGSTSPMPLQALCKRESFPRMWDQLCHRIQEPLSDRIIPTYVGSTPIQPNQRALTANHSHVCGINRSPRMRHFYRTESFPRMWDQHIIVSGGPQARRIIPTYVGSTAFETLYIWERSNHSHVCGINFREGMDDLEECESFPRMWDQLESGGTS